MPDVNYIQYGENLARVSQTGADTSAFLADNGWTLGFLMAFIVIIILLCFILILIFKFGRKMLP